MSNSPAAYLEDGRLVIRASSLDRCQRCLVGLALGFTPMSPPEKAVAVFQRGHRVEDEVIPAIQKQGWIVTARQDQVELPVGDTALIRGHIDGILVKNAAYSDDPYYIHDVFRHIGASRGPNDPILEVKSCAPTSWDAWTTGRWSAWDKWEWQTSVYGYATGLPVVVVAAQVIDGQWTGTLDSFTIPEPRIPLSRIHARVLDIQRYVDEGRLPPTCSSNDYPCPLWHMCSHPEAPPETDPALDALAFHLDTVRAERKKWEGVEKETRQRIDELLGARDKVATAAFEAIARDQVERKTLDRDKLEEAFGDLSAYEKTTLTTRIRVTKRKDGGRGIEASGGSVGAADQGADISSRDGGEREDGSGDGDRRPVTTDSGDEDFLHPRDRPQPGSGTVSRDDPLASEER